MSCRKHRHKLRFVTVATVSFKNASLRVSSVRKLRRSARLIGRTEIPRLETRQPPPSPWVRYYRSLVAIAVTVYAPFRVNSVTPLISDNTAEPTRRGRAQAASYGGKL